MSKADALSRRVDHKKGVENDNSEVVLLKPDYFYARAMERGHLVIEGVEEGLLKRIRDAKEFDENIVEAVESLKKTGNKTLRSDEWHHEQGLWLYRGKVYVPKDTHLRTELIKLHHDSAIAGHPGQWKTLELLTQNYW